MKPAEFQSDRFGSIKTGTPSGMWPTASFGNLHPEDVPNRTVGRVPFDGGEIRILEHAIEIAEDLVSNHYKISTSEWKRYRYDIQSLADLTDEEITDRAFAQIRRYLRCPDQRLTGSNPADFFKICLQDHMIRQATQRDVQIGLLPLAIYIIIHELIHVIRFARFIQRFQTSPAEQEAEEIRVHDLTFILLKNCRITGIQDVLAAFKDCRTMETFLGASEAVSRPRG
jgi:hypothetical protein